MNFAQIKGVILGSGKKNVFPENTDIVRRLGADSMVLLKNDGTLPIKRGRIALFGAGAIDTIFCGNFSAYVEASKKVTVKEGLHLGGFSFSSTGWLEKMKKATDKAKKDDRNIDFLNKEFSGVTNHPEEVLISQEDLEESLKGTDICVYVLRRATVERHDRKLDKGDYYLSESEEKNLELLSSHFKKIVLVLNSGIVDISKLEKNKSIGAILYMGIPGMEAGNSLCDVLTGVTNPNGHLVDTWAKKYKDYPSCSSHAKKNAKDASMDYSEGIYVGYRYFDTYGVKPLYPFGHGLSYTSFMMELTYFEANWFSILLRIKVTNTGEVSGRQSVQLYVSSPVGKIDKPHQELRGFAKTGKIRPGDSEEVEIKINTTALSSFDEKKSAYVMEKGKYIFRIGDSSVDTKAIASLALDKTTVIENVFEVVKQTKELEFIPLPEYQREKVNGIEEFELKRDDYNSQNDKQRLEKKVITYIPEGRDYKSVVKFGNERNRYNCREVIEYVKPCSYTSFMDVLAENVTIEEFVASLPKEVLARIVVGTMDESVKEYDDRLNKRIKLKKAAKLAGGTTSQYAKSLGIPGASMADGALGLRIPFVSTTCYPSPNNMAQTWDVGAMGEFGRAYGREMQYHNVDFCLAPAINIHRDPLGSRACEYYSEDPYISGIMGAAFTKGVQHNPGRCVVLKHMSVYNHERDLEPININLSRRALREIYLKGFELSVKIASPVAIMNSNNLINGEFASSRRGINMDIVRKEWGFGGFIMTEWGTKSNKGDDIHAGCDLIMPGYSPQKIIDALKETAPVFESDGYVRETGVATYFNIPVIHYNNWGSFVPDATGEDIAMTTVNKGVEINPKVIEMEKSGLCTISKSENGVTTIRYKGYNRGAYMTLGDLQHAVIHILKGLEKTGAMMELKRQIQEN